jgi:hypothetical protein
LANEVLEKEQLELTIAKLKLTLEAKKDDFIAGLETFVKTRTAGGMTNEAIIQALKDDFDNDGPLFGSLKSRITQTFTGFIGDVADDVKDSVFEEEYGEDFLDQPYMWVATLINTCPDCIDLHGEIQSLTEWEEEGIPNVRPTVCTFRGNCHCELVPMASMSEKDKKSVLEPIKLQRERIKEYSRIRKEDGVSLSADYEKALLGQALNEESIVR